jgi:TolA-binding protein
MKVCPTCGEGLSDEAKFCPVDGTSLLGVAPIAPDQAATGGSPFSKTLYFGGGVPAPAAMDAPQAAPPPPRPPEARHAGVAFPSAPAAASGEINIELTPSDAPVPVPHAPAARAPSPFPSMTLERPKSPAGLILGAALGGATVVGLLALGVNVVRRGRSGRPAPVAAAPAPPRTPTGPPAPAVPPPAPPAPPAPAAAAPASPAAVAPATQVPVAAASPAAPVVPVAPPVPTVAAVAPSAAHASHESRRTSVAEPGPTGPAPPADPKQAQIYLRAGREHLGRGAYSKAQAAFEQARAYDPESDEALAGLGEVAFEQGRYGDAIDKLRAAVRLNRSSRYLVPLGNSYFKQGQYRQAAEQYKRALQLEHGNKEAADGLEAAQKKLRGE